MLARRTPAAVLAAGMLLLASHPARTQTFDDTLDFDVSVWSGMGRLAQLQYQTTKLQAVEDPDFSIKIDPVSVETVECNYQNDLFLRKRPGRTKYADITLKRGYNADVRGSTLGHFFDNWQSESASCLASPDCSSWGGKSSVKDIDITVWPSGGAKDGPGSRIYSFKNCLVTRRRVIVSKSSRRQDTAREVEEVVIQIGHVDIIAPKGATDTAGALTVGQGYSDVQVVFAGEAGRRETVPISVSTYLNPGTALVPAREAPRCEWGGGLDNDCDGIVVEDDDECVADDPDALFACPSTIAAARLADACGINVTKASVVDPSATDVSFQYSPSSSAEVKSGAPLMAAPSPSPYLTASSSSVTLDTAPAGRASFVGNTAVSGSTSCASNPCPRPCTNNPDLCAINTGTRCAPRCSDGVDDDCDCLADEAETHFGAGARLVPRGNGGEAGVDCGGLEARLASAKSFGGGKLGDRNLGAGSTTKPPILLVVPDESSGASPADTNPELFFRSYGFGRGNRIGSSPSNRAELLRTAQPSGNGAAENYLVGKRGYVAQGTLLLEPTLGGQTWMTGDALHRLHRKHKRHAARAHRKLARAHRRAADQYPEDVQVVTFSALEGDPLTCLDTAGEVDGLTDKEAFEQGKSVGLKAARPGCSGEGCTDYFDNAFLRQYDFPSFSSAGVSGEKVWVEVDKKTCTYPPTGGVLTTNVCHF